MAQDFMAKEIPGIVDARDVAEAMIAALERGRPGEKYIVAGEFHTNPEGENGQAHSSRHKDAPCNRQGTAPRASRARDPICGRGGIGRPRLLKLVA
jgi:hypothetical protein